MTALFVYLQRLVALTAALCSLLGINKNTETVELYANPASGYTWEYSYDKNGILTLATNHYTPDLSSLGSGGGTQEFTFKALSSGTVNVTFEYIKFQDGTVASKYVYTYHVDTNGNITLQEVQ